MEGVREGQRKENNQEDPQDLNAADRVVMANHHGMLGLQIEEGM